MQECKEYGRFLNLAYIVPSLRNTGPIVVVRDLVHLMQKRGHHCKVYYFDPICELSFDCQVELLSMTQKIAMQDYDIVHTHGFRPDLYVFLHKPLRTKTVFVTSMHNYLFNDFYYTYGRFKGFFYACLYLIAMSRADFLVALSRDAQKYYSRFLPKSKCRYVYNTTTCNFSLFMQQKDISEIETFRADAKYLIGSIGCLAKRKGFERIIQAMPLLKGVKLCIVGDGEQHKELVEMMRSLGLSDRVLLVGYKQDAYKYIPFFDVCVLPSRSEGFPLFVLESACCAKPMVVSDIPIFSEIFSKDEIVSFKGNDTEDLAIAIEYAYNNRLELSDKIRDKFNDVYAPDKFYKNYRNLYSELINKK